MSIQFLPRRYNLVAASIVVLLNICCFCSCGKDVMLRNGKQFGYFQSVQNAGCQIVPLDNPYIFQAIKEGRFVRINQKDYLTCKSAENLKDAVEEAAAEARQRGEELEEAAKNLKDAVEEAAEEARQIR